MLAYTHARTHTLTNAINQIDRGVFIALWLKCNKKPVATYPRLPVNQYVYMYVCILYIIVQSYNDEPQNTKALKSLTSTICGCFRLLRQWQSYCQLGIGKYKQMPQVMAQKLRRADLFSYTCAYMHGCVCVFLSSKNSRCRCDRLL